MGEAKRAAVHNVALDPGFGGFKAAAVVAGAIQTAMVPSVVGVGQTNLGMLSLAGVTGRRRRRRKIEPYRVTFNGADMLVGAGVVEYARPMERLDFQCLGESIELRVLTYATLFELLSAGGLLADDANLNLVVGLPVEVLQGPEANETVKRLKGWLVGEHCFAVDGQQTTLHIRHVVPMAQPVGTFCEWGLGLDGRWRRDRDDALATLAVLDLGFNTLDLLGVRNGRISARYTEGDTLGMRRAAQALVQSIRSQYQVGDLSLHEADELVREYVRGRGRRPVKLSVPGGRQDVSHLVATAVDVAASEVLAFVAQVLDSNKVTVGPDSYPVGARVCNIGDTTATNVTATFVSDGAINPYISLEGASTLSIPSLPPGPTSHPPGNTGPTPDNCTDFYFTVVVTRDLEAYDATQPYHIEATADGLGIVSTPAKRELYVERLISQNKNEVLGFSGETDVLVGHTYTYTVTAQTATNGSKQLVTSVDFPNLMFQVLSVSVTYSAPPGATNNAPYADACGWDPNIGPTPPQGTYRSCVGPEQYAGGKAGGNVTMVYTVKILSAGTATLSPLIYDFSGASYHYNSDFGLDVLTVTATEPTAVTLVSFTATPLCRAPRMGDCH